MIINSNTTEYITNQGDMWDIISLRCYGDTRAMHWIIDANYDRKFEDKFPANVKLVIPATVSIGLDLRSVRVPNINEMLPWR